MPRKAAPRPAHRPSRRHQIVDAAIELFVVAPPELVTIAEVVKRAGMTPAAFYYHFSSREELLQEIVELFGRDWVAQAQEAWADAPGGDPVASVPALLDWCQDRRGHATVYFVTSKGVSVSVEEARQRFTAELAASLAASVRRELPGDEVGAAVKALSMVAVIESCLRSELSQDPTSRVLAPERFRDEVMNLCRRVLGTS